MPLLAKKPEDSPKNVKGDVMTFEIPYVEREISLLDSMSTIDLK